MSAGLPNITGETVDIITTWGSASPDGYGSGIIRMVEQAKAGPASSNKTYNARIELDASRVSSIYGNSNTVQPATCKTYFIIKY